MRMKMASMQKEIMPGVDDVLKQYLPDTVHSQVSLILNGQNVT